MKNNVISILVDSVVWECVGTKRTRVSATPFLDSLKSESITASKLYSHAPYTDAATRSLYTGRNTLDDYSFFYKLNSAPINHFQFFHENGYETFGIYYPYYMYGKDMQKNIDHSYYTSHFIFDSEWNTFKWFADRIASSSLEKREMKLLEKRFELMFEVWIHYYEDILDHPERITLLQKPFEESNTQDSLKQLKDLYSRFLKDKSSFIISFLEGNYKDFQNIDTIEFDKQIDRTFIDSYIFGTYNNVFSKAETLNRKANAIKSFPSIKRLWYGISRYIKTKNIDEIKFLANYWFSLRTIKDMKKASHKFEWQCVSSARNQMKLASNILNNRTSNSPFYMSLHLLEPHNYISCFTFDTQDKSVIDEEMSVLNDFLDQVGSDFRGNILFFLSLRYVDYCIEKFCNKLKEMGLWDNTTLLFVADHGSSYTFNPLHGARVNTFDDECYHIPMMIRSPNLKPFEFPEFCNSKDVLPTLADVVGLKASPLFKGHSMLDKNYKWPDYVMTEYTGPGCPEVRGRRLWLSVRNQDFMVAYRVGVYEQFEEGELVEVHDLRKDPNCLYNLVNRVDMNKIIPLLEIIKKRVEEVNLDSLSFVTNLFNN